MAPDAPSDERDPASTPGASAVVPSGTNAVVVYSDLRCPWAYVSVRRLLTAVERQGVESELTIDHRWFPLGDEAMPVEPDAVDRKLEPFRALEPDAAWHRWSGGAEFPRSSRSAAAWVQAAKRVGPAASTALDRAIRVALFDDGRDISDESVLEDVAGAVLGEDLATARTEVASGRCDAELDRHEELARSDLVPASPTIVLTDGTTWTNPGIEFHTEDGTPVVDADEPDVYGEIIDAFLALRHYD